jgi:2-isopropylmalate synthase
MKINKVKLDILDSTLRDGAQAEGISFTVADKVLVAKLLDAQGIDFIEAGNPGSNPKDAVFFEEMKENPLKTAKLVAFGATRRPHSRCDEDENLKALIHADTEFVTVFGKSWDLHVTEIIGTTQEENLLMIKETVAYLCAQGKRVIFDAEHFFDGYSANESYAFEALYAAISGGAHCVVLCETNGGRFPSEIYEATQKVVNSMPPGVEVGIHCHNDGGMAVANTIMAVEAGATHVQGTFTGFGERCGNVNLSTVIPNLQLKRNFLCIPVEKMPQLVQTAKKLSDIANTGLNEREPYVGNSAFAHKGGMHIDGVIKLPHSFEHIDPSSVGNARRFLMSEVSGRNTLFGMVQKIEPGIDKNANETKALLQTLKNLEFQGYQFEGAENSFELVIRKQLGKYKPFFELIHYRIVDEKPGNITYAFVKVLVKGQEEVAVAEGNGPVNALDLALRKALTHFYPTLSQVQLTDYKVRVVEPEAATGAKVRVVIESSDGLSKWHTVGVSPDIIEASWLALVDSIEYKLITENQLREVQTWA